MYEITTDGKTYYVERKVYNGEHFVGWESIATFKTRKEAEGYYRFLTIL